MNESVPQTALACRNLLNQQCFPGEVRFAKAPKNVERPNARMPLQMMPRRCFELDYTRTDLGKQYLPASVDFQGHEQSAPNLPSEQGLRRPSEVRCVSTGSCSWMHPAETWLALTQQVLIPQPEAIPFCSWERPSAEMWSKVWIYFSGPQQRALCVPSATSPARGERLHKQDWCAVLPWKLTRTESPTVLGALGNLL